MGRLIQTKEVLREPGSPPQVFTTTYTYTVFDTVDEATQGVQTRSYKYDGLGRLLETRTPEMEDPNDPNDPGIVTYDYNDLGQVAHRIDARNVKTTYGYDGLNRL
ncbi:MAG: hypothetical protein ACYSUI_12335, partial [Planctomycetota bacterium]